MMKKLLWGLIGLSSLSCGGIGQVEVRQAPTDEPLAVPRITAERLQACVKEHGEQLASGSWAFSPEIQVNQKGYVVDVDAGGVPNTAPDLAACTRIALGDMAIPSAVFNIRPTQPVATNEPTAEQRSLVSSPALVVVVVVGLSEVVFEAGAYTILFAVTVKVVDKAIDDVAELARRKKKDRDWDECLNRYEACVAGRLYQEQGKSAGDSRCGLCLGICYRERKWPPFVDLGPCQ